MRTFDKISINVIRDGIEKCLNIFIRNSVALVEQSQIICHLYFYI